MNKSLLSDKLCLQNSFNHSIGKNRGNVLKEETTEAQMPYSVTEQKQDKVEQIR